jgi:hypothetical protein
MKKALMQQKPRIFKKLAKIFPQKFSKKHAFSVAYIKSLKCDFKQQK